MGTVRTTKYVRKPLYVDAVQVTKENFLDIVEWCQATVGANGAELGTEIRPAAGAEIDPEAHYLRIRVHNPRGQHQTKAVVGDWILYTDRGYKIYNEKAFEANFDLVNPDSFAAEMPVSLPPELSAEEEAKTV